jgi:hypothetical protein
MKSMTELVLFAATFGPGARGAFGLKQTFRSQNLSRLRGDFVDGRLMAGVEGLPLLRRPVEIAALVIELAEPFDELRFVAAGKSKDVGGAEITIARE